MFISDLLRVSCYGEATIVEVSSQYKAVIETNGEEEDNENKTKTEIEKSNIKSSIQLLESNKTKQEQRMEIINKELSLLQTYASCISSVSFMFFNCINIFTKLFFLLKKVLSITCLPIISLRIR